MSPRRILILALATQGALIALAWFAGDLLGVPPIWGNAARDVPIGLAVAVLLALVNYALLVWAPGGWLVNGVRRVYDHLLLRLFAGFGPVSIVLLGAAAGIGEEWLFRGVMQPILGLLATSVVFGLAHVGGRQMLPFGVWAAAMGLVLGTLAKLTGGLIAPIVAHAVYDMLALEYIRRGAATT